MFTLVDIDRPVGIENVEGTIVSRGLGLDRNQKAATAKTLGISVAVFVGNEEFLQSMPEAALLGQDRCILRRALVAQHGDGIGLQPSAKQVGPRPFGRLAAVEKGRGGAPAIAGA